MKASKKSSGFRSGRATLPLLTLLFSCLVTVLSACSDSGERTPTVVPDEVNEPVQPAAPVDSEFPEYTVLPVEAGDDFEVRLLEALITASPQTIIELPSGVYDFAGELSVSVDNIVIRGTGTDAENGTVLRFDNQTTGSQGILATGDNIVIEDLAVENTPGDGIKITGSNGVTIRRVRMEWTNGPDENNGAYGLYPVQTRNVLIEDCEVRGASDAGVYVGQSENIIVRRNFVYENVAGIEIENSKFADVYENETTANTGGILVFDLPGPPVQGGEATRVFNNNVYDNNTPNFAPAGNIVAQVPGGTGIMVMANDDIEVFENTITGNSSAGILIVSYYFIDLNISKPSYDPVPEKIYIHDNDFSGNSEAPMALADAISQLVFDGNMVDIFYDSSGVNTDAGLLVEFPEGLTEDQRICIVDNGEDTTIGRANGSVLLFGLPYDADISTSTTDYNCTHAALPEIVLEAVGSSNDDGEVVDAAALCGAGGEGINADAFPADCPNLSDYRLFEDAGDPTQNASGGVKYDLTTPLFSDYARKHRFVFLPEGSSAAYRESAVFDFPVGTIIAKTFAIQSDLRDPASSQDVIETRLLIKRLRGWDALPYIWNDEKTDAVLTVTGGTKAVSWIDAAGEERSTDYIVPNSNNCANCHGEDGIFPIGPKARLLNKSFDYGGEVANQIDYWVQQDILSGAPSDTSAIVTIPLESDTDAPLDDRARGYLDINCAHCHGVAGAGDTSGLLLDYTRAFGLEVGECKPPVAAGDGAGDLQYAIVPGDADASIMVFRMNSNETDVRMPEIGRSIVHTQGVELIREWINAMDPVDCGS
ncbi:MAG: parallel beta-helix domain-containing protein [Halioglobus sp.]